MNEYPQRTGWSGSPPNRVPALAANGPRELWQPPPAYPSEDSAYGQTDAHNFVQDLRRYFWILFRHRWAVLGVTAAFLAIGALITFLSTPIYRASTTIQIDREPAKILNVEEIQTDLGSDAAFYATQYEILKSRSLADRVASDLSVEDLEAFSAHNTVSPLRKLVGAIARLISPRNDEPEGDVVAILQNAVADEILDRLAVQPVGTSRVVKLSFTYPDPAWAQRIANAVANTFVALTLERRFEASSYARNFLEERLKELKVKLEDSEAQLVRYAQEQKIVNVDERKSLVTANLEALNAQLAEASRERLRAEQMLSQANTTDGLSLPQVLTDESVQSMRERRSQIAAQYQDQLRFFKPAYPDMTRLKAQIDETERQIQDAVDVVRESIRGEYRGALAEEESLARDVEELKSEVLDLESRGIRYRILQREVDTNRQLYDGLLQRFKEVGVAGAVGTNNVSVVDVAGLPKSPYKPRLSVNLALALAFGFFCGGLVAFGIEFLDDTFKVPEDVESNLNLPVLGIIPIALADDAFANPRSSVAEAYRSLRTALQFSTAEGAPKTLLVTSSRPGEGKSTTALALSRNFAQLGLRVLLIDGDLRNPSLHRSLGMPATAGLSNYLTGNALPPGVFQRAEQGGLTFMACGPLPPNPAELLAGPKMSSLLAVASERFDLVIIDGPPVMGIADAPLLASIASGTLLVIEAGQARRGVTRAALKRLHFARAQMVGALLSKFNARDVGHTYGYGYGYGYGDTDYYGYGSQTVPRLEEALAEDGEEEQRQGAA
jgi:capsular exopolysaccharide synthesis family protein